MRPVNEVKQTSKNYVLEHISAFPVVESHYSRAHTEKRFLDSDLSISKMYRLYVKWIEEKQIRSHIVTERQYRDIFNYNFNFGFFKPKKDQCNDCTSYSNQSPSDKEKNKLNFEKHIEMKNEARRIKNIDKAAATVNEHIVTACYDFQKILQCPFGETSIFFYKRKLNLHNFTIYNLSNRQGFCYLWDETIAGQGASEVASCLYQFILDESSKNNVKKFIFWSDNCPGQNKNKILYSFYSWVSRKLNVDIHHKYLEKGHTQNEGDSMHSRIEKCRKHKTIFTPAQYYSLIRNSKVSGSSYIVHEVEQKDIFNFQKVADSFFFAKNIKNEPFWTSKLREVYISKDEPNKLNYKYEFGDNFQEVILYFDENVLKRRGRKRKAIDRDNVDQLHNESIAISDQKYQDLMFLCKNNYIPGLYHQFFENLPHTNTIS